MRTAFTLDDDVAAWLKRIAGPKKGSATRVVNRALWLGLPMVSDRQPRRAPFRFRTTGFDLGPSLVGSLDDLEQVLARSEGEAHK